MEGYMDLNSVHILTACITNGLGVVLLIVLHYASRARILRDRTEDRFYSVLVFGIMLGCLAEAFSYVLNGWVFPGCRIISHIVNTYIFTANMLLPFCLLVYIDLCLYGDVKRIWKHYKPQIVTGAVMLAVNIVNFFYPISYYITEQNEYKRASFGFVYYAVILFYCLTIVFVLKRYEKEYGARAFFNFGMFLVPILVGAGLQFLFYGLSLAWLSSSIGLVGLFMMQQNEMAYVDSLVRTYNRQYLDHILSAWISRNRRFAGVMMDIDRFKSINDSLGHSEGDKALKALAKILKRSARGHEWVFRFAGDEFIVIKLTEDPGELQSYMEEVERGIDAFNAEGRPYLLAISYGVSVFDRDVDTFLKDMDEKMYRMKDEHHKERETAVISAPSSAE